MEIIKFRKSNKLQDSDVLEINKIIDNLENWFDYKFYFYHKNKFLINIYKNKCFKITKNGKLRKIYMNKKIKKTLLNFNFKDCKIKEFSNICCYCDNYLYFFKLINSTSINQYYNKRKAELLSKLMNQDENRRTSNKIEKLTLKRNNKIEDYMHKASRMLVDKLVEFNIGTVIIGKNDGWKTGVNIGDKNNQNFTLIPHSKFINMLEYKCRLVGIDVILQEESYTSKCSLVDLEPIEHRDEYVGRRISRGLFKSKDGIIINADINGSGNIMRKAIPNCLTTNGIEGFVVSPVRITPKGYYPYKQVS